MSFAALEGRLTVRLGAGGTQLATTLALPVTRLFEGRSSADVLGLLPTLYAVCGRAHVAAASAAMDAASGRAAGPVQRRARSLVVAAEALREHLLRILCDWGALLGQSAHPVIISDVMGLPERVADDFGSDWRMQDSEFPETSVRIRPAALETTDTLIERHVLGCSAARWSALDSVDAALTPGRARALGPRFLQWLVDQGHAASGGATLPSLPALTPHWLMQRFADETPEARAPHPEWEGAPRETGAFARRREHPLVQAFVARWGAGLLARSVARLVDVAELALQLRGAQAFEVLALAAGTTGYGIVETARGRLAHRVTLEGERVTRLQILAPTEWNCHPSGVMAACLDTLPLDAQAAQRAALVVECIDPCIGYTIEVPDRA